LEAVDGKANVHKAREILLKSIQEYFSIIQNGGCHKKVKKSGK
jgi:hypothetical protein